ncbi:MAG: glutathione S-transferase family protein [Burkholderiales bacterium]
MTATSSSSPSLTLISHALCPYVQRAAIVLAEKGMPFERRDVDLSAKPAWFRAVSPLGKTPVLLVDDAPIFESAVICEYLDETVGPRLHPANALERARHRSWIEFGSQLLNLIAGLYSASDESQIEVRRAELMARFAQVEAALGAGPYFAGREFSIVDAAYAPVFRYFDTFERFTDLRIFGDTPKLRRWRASLAMRPSVRDAVSPQYPDRLMDFLKARGSALSQRIEAALA